MNCSRPLFGILPRSRSMNLKQRPRVYADFQNLTISGESSWSVVELSMTFIGKAWSFGKEWRSCSTPMMQMVEGSRMTWRW